jgi:hypothetical protein
MTITVQGLLRSYTRLVYRVREAGLPLGSKRIRQALSRPNVALRKYTRFLKLSEYNTESSLGTSMTPPWKVWPIAVATWTQNLAPISGHVGSLVHPRWGIPLPAVFGCSTRVLYTNRSNSCPVLPTMQCHPQHSRQPHRILRDFRPQIRMLHPKPREHEISRKAQ